MKKRFMKKLCLIMALCITATTIAACTPNKGEGDSSEESKSSENSSSEAKASKTWKDNTDPVDLTLYFDAGWVQIDNWGKDVASKMAMEESGVNFVVEKPTADDSQRLNMLIASNELPDMIIADRNNPAWDEMIKNKQLAAMEKLMDEYAPELKSTMDPAILKNNTNADGSVYRIPNFVDTPSGVEMTKKYKGLIGTGQSTFSVRQDYYDEVGRPKMDTPESFIEGLKLMQAKHPDKIPFYCGTSDWQNNSERLKMYFGIGNYFEDGGELKHNVLDPKWKDMFMWMNDLYTNGLMGKESLVDDSEVAGGKVKQGLMIARASTVAGDVPDDNPNTTYEPIDPFATYKDYRVGAGWMGIGITEASKNKDRAIQFLEYTNTAPGFKSLVYGIEGEEFKSPEEGAHYHVVDGQPQYLQSYMDEKLKDWGGMERKTGLGIYFQFIFDNANMNLPTWVATDEKMAKLNEVYTPLVEFKPEWDINFPAGSEELVLKTKLNDIIKEATVNVVFADTKEKAQKEFDTMMQRLNDAGIDKYNTFITEQFKK